MEVQAHTTPESRQALRNYLRDRRMTTSIHQTTTAQTLNDLEEALHLLGGIEHPNVQWFDEVSGFLDVLLQRTVKVGAPTECYGGCIRLSFTLQVPWLRTAPQCRRVRLASYLRYCSDALHERFSTRNQKTKQ